MIFYEAPRKLRGTLDDLAAAFGADRSVSLCRELTKLHEEIKKDDSRRGRGLYKDNDPRGEYVLVLAGTDPCRRRAGRRADPGRSRRRRPRPCKRAVCPSPPPPNRPPPGHRLVRVKYIKSL